jgi:cellulose synthase/poly-beta-1,6-N-acetylglucosamine synthase-like glycosyltransferase
MSLFLFWGATALIVYTYVVFPAVVFLRGRLVRRPYQTAEITPKVSMIIAAHNDARGIGAKLDNILSLDYPREELEVIIVSDGSNDGTETIVRGYADQGVRLLARPRQGKAPALNAAVAAASGEILVFSDANSMYAPDAIRALARPFADPEVGGVAGNQVYLPKPASAAESSAGEHTYWNFDRKLKQSQSTAGNAISATGAIYAIRRALFQGVPLGVTDDFATSTSVIAQGYRLVFAPDAIAYEPAAQSSVVEFGRKTRVITRGLRGVLVRRELLNPFRYGFYALQLFSHKLLRRLVVFPLLALLLVSPLLWSRGWLYKLATLGQAAFYGFGLLGWLLGGTKIGRKKIFSIPFFFCMVNAASFIAALNVLRGKRIDFWEPQRQDVSNSSPMGEQRRLEIGD